MATYTLISSNVLTSTAATVTFSSIPSTYTDLVLRCSMRSDRASAAADRYKLTFNSSATGYSILYLSGDGSSAGSGLTASTSYIEGINAVDATTATSNTFSTVEIYIPSYTVSQNKPIGIAQAQEDNSATAFIYPTAALWRDTSAITSISFAPRYGTNFVSGSSFYLYGISNA